MLCLHIEHRTAPDRGSSPVMAMSCSSTSQRS